jgi:hypothetical protein
MIMAGEDLGGDTVGGREGKASWQAAKKGSKINQQYKRSIEITARILPAFSVIVILEDKLGDKLGVVNRQGMRYNLPAQIQTGA